MPDAIEAMLELLLDEPEDELAQLLTELRWLALKHTLAARAAWRALRAEGRRFAGTPEGRAWCQHLAGSDLIRRGQLIWEVGTANALDADDDQALPSALIDAFARAAARRDLDAALARRLEPHPQDDTP